MTSSDKNVFALPDILEFISFACHTQSKQNWLFLILPHSMIKEEINFWTNSELCIINVCVMKSYN